MMRRRSCAVSNHEATGKGISEISLILRDARKKRAPQDEGHVQEQKKGNTIMIEFFFDCSSPWTYLAFHNIQPLA